jgi:transposase
VRYNIRVQNATVCGVMAKRSELQVPDNLEQCQVMLVQMFEQMQSMQGQLDALIRARYGRKGEQLPAGQLQLFADVSEVAHEEDTASVAEKAVNVTPHGRRKPNKELVRIPRTYDVNEDEIPCPDCQKPREIVGEEKSEQYDYKPSSLQVIEHIRIKRACLHCKKSVITATKPADVIDKGLATADMLAYIATSKFVDHLPLHRLEGIFKRDGASIARSTMCDWLAATAKVLIPLYELMKKRVLESDVIWTDDTPIKMQDRSDERNMRNARVWVYLGDELHPYIVFDFTESRRRDGPVRFLGSFSGCLQADAFAGYDCIYAGGNVEEVACWAHARRKFFEAIPTQSKLGGEAVSMINEFYAVEKEIAHCKPTEKKHARQEKTVPLLNAFKAWLDKQRLVALPKSPLGKAVMYALNNWKALNTYTASGDLTIDNNKSERAIRGMAVGRKNWLFVGSANGGNTAVILTSILASAIQHGLHPRNYLSDVLRRLALGEEDLQALLPDKWVPIC